MIHHWTCMLFLAAADFVMILRVWAMYNQSKPILGFLLILFSLEILSLIVAAVVYAHPQNMPVVTLQILEYKYCAVQLKPRIWNRLTDILQIVFAAALCVLAVVQFVKQSLQMYRLTKQWQINRYMNLLVRQGVTYFFAIFLINFVDLLTATGKLPTSGKHMESLYLLSYVSLFTLTPRFIMSIRELHTQNMQGRCGTGIDTGFGFSMISYYSRRPAFVDVEQSDGTEIVEDIPMEVRKAELE
ncbi:hypothetical protein JVU11DRAFT_4507 [Chiua virens]|nr:hypothetical protein JVU11DRAFT_4507 [Chiua virens]